MLVVVPHSKQRARAARRIIHLLSTCGTACSLHRVGAETFFGGRSATFFRCTHAPNRRRAALLRSLTQSIHVKNTANLRSYSVVHAIITRLICGASADNGARRRKRCVGPGCAHKSGQRRLGPPLGTAQQRVREAALASTHAPQWGHQHSTHACAKHILTNCACRCLV